MAGSFPHSHHRACLSSPLSSPSSFLCFHPPFVLFSVPELLWCISPGLCVPSESQKLVALGLQETMDLRARNDTQH